jgi:hypothetical protein
LALTILAVAVGCNGTGSSSSTPATPAPAPASGTFTVVSGGSTFFDLPGVGTTTAGSATLGTPTAGGGTTGTFTVSASNPTSSALTSDKRPASVAGANGVWYLSLTFSKNVTVAALPSFGLEFSTPQPATLVFWSAIYNGTSWTEPWSGPGTLSNGGSTLAIPAKAATPYTFTAGTNYVIAIYTTAATPTPTPSPTPSPSPTPATPTPSPTPNAITNGDFETGSIAPWYVCRAGHPTLAAPIDPNPAEETPAPTFTQAPLTAVPSLVATPGPDPVVVTTLAAASAGNPNNAPHGGTHAAQIGNILTGAGNAREKGIIGICQDVAVPATGSPTLTAWVWEGGDNGNFGNGDSEMDVFSGATWVTGTVSVSGATESGKQTANNPTATLFAEMNCYNNNGTSGGTSTTNFADCVGQAAAPGVRGGQWVKKGPYSMTAYAGTTVTVLIGSLGTSNSTGYYEYLYADDVVLTHS